MDNNKENYMTILSKLRFENNLRVLLKKPMPLHREIVEISRMMSPTPDWFKQIKLCSKTCYPFGTKNRSDITHCTLSCSNVYNMTKLINYGTLPKKSDIVYSNTVGFFSFGNEKWFDNVELCYRLRSSKTNKNGKCAIERQRTLCAKLNSFTSYYPIKTDSNCRIQWMISIPSDAPFWIQGIQLCVWYDCYKMYKLQKFFRSRHFIKTHVKCALPNKYTFDNPYGSTFRCRPKLGILPNNREII